MVRTDFDFLPCDAKSIIVASAADFGFGLEIFNFLFRGFSNLCFSNRGRSTLKGLDPCIISAPQREQRNALPALERRCLVNLLGLMFALHLGHFRNTANIFFVAAGQVSSISCAWASLSNGAFITNPSVSGNGNKGFYIFLALTFSTKFRQGK